MLSRFSVTSLGFTLLVLTGVCFACSSAQFDKKECNDRPRPYSQLMSRTGFRVRQKCSAQGSSCNPSSTLCCGNMGCYNYEGGRCDYPLENCICRNRDFMVEW